MKLLRDRQLGMDFNFFHCGIVETLGVHSCLLMVADTVLNMLHLNRETQKITTLDEIQDESVSWKVLVYDKFGCDVIAPLLKVGELRDNGVTLHL